LLVMNLPEVRIPHPFYRPLMAFTVYGFIFFRDGCWEDVIVDEWVPPRSY